MAAGAIARGVAQTVLHPVDVVRTRLQARGVSSSWRPSVFIKGVVPQISLAIPAGAMQFLAFEAAKEKLAQLLPDDSFAQVRVLLAGAAGALAAASFRIPQEVLKQRIQADIYPNVLVALRETLGKQGVLSLYKGSVATISRDVPWNALSFLFHAQGKKIFANVKGRAPRNDENLAVAGVAGAVAAIIMTPVDVVKTRIMTQRVGAAVQYSGIIATLQKIVAEEGAGTLMKGVLPRIVFLAPLAGITFSVYEAVAKNIRQRKAAEAVQVGEQPADNSRVVRKAPRKGLRLRAFGLRFAKTPARVAAAKAPMGTFVGDYAAASPVFFSLPC
ncbi:similar to solute carrier protein [Chondrus crispus]|uniref:Similar to solute carrier protein n=1 Tax=Chondrus crispus TaxID=2769 RepID=R7QAE2_CHOCR|nr:similar to solute carrier protein [Chondrus crispus]CDF34999.1 similar to solute carrier protein [Chondrus crispus]|eukprot:XP_005714818.1 similar to solute carrier protein [Chondrus crispus]